MERIRIHTNFTATANKIYDIPLAEMGEARNLEIMRWLFHEPERLRPGTTSEDITAEVAERLAGVAQNLRGRGLDPVQVARFLDRIVFCLFAEDVGLLPPRLFSQIVEKARDAEHFARLIGQLFDAMQRGGDFGLETIRHFNGNLFTDSPVLLLTEAEIKHVQAAARLDWAAVDPSVFGTLFERGLDPAKRAQLGAQYTSRADIETLIEPVVVAIEFLLKHQADFDTRMTRFEASQAETTQQIRELSARQDRTQVQLDHLSTVVASIAEVTQRNSADIDALIKLVGGVIEGRNGKSES
jgi:hypothetical protein